METTITTPYTLKIWNSSEEWDEGNATFSPFPFTEKDLSPRVIAGLHGRIMSGEIWAFEVFDTKTGETQIHSEE